MTDEVTFLTEQIEATEAQIRALRTAMLGITSGAISSYELQTGQTVQRVTKINISLLKNAIDGLMNDWDVYRIRLNGAGSRVVPGW